jgi:hypothetical protein
MSPTVKPDTMDDMSRSVHLRTGAALLALAGIALSACGNDEPARARAAASPSAEATPSPTASPSAEATPSPTASPSAAATPESERVLRTSRGDVLEMPPGCGPIPTQLRGTWTYELRPKDIPPEWSDARTGPAEKTFGPGHFYTGPVNGEGSAAHACVKGDVVHTSRHPDCPEDAGNEMLRWAVNGDELTLTPLPENRCFLTHIHFGKPTRSRTLQRKGS